MARGKLNWYGDSISDQVRAEMHNRLRACGLAVMKHAKKLIGVGGTGTTGPGRDSRGKFTKGRLIYGADPSKPGEPPRHQTGRLWGSVAFEVVGMVARVGTNVKYGRWLELGTSQMAARPWLRRALFEMKPRIQAILSKPMNFRKSK